MKNKQCPEDKCKKCPINGQCPLQDPDASLEEVKALVDSYMAHNPILESVPNNEVPSVDDIVKNILSEFDQMHSIWNSLTGWQIEPPNDSVGGFAWRLRSLLPNKIEFTGKDEVVMREVFEIIAHIMYEAIHEKCDGSKCKRCIINNHCPLESRLREY